jgi:hypothetical protein
MLAALRSITIATGAIVHIKNCLCYSIREVVPSIHVPLVDAGRVLLGVNILSILVQPTPSIPLK